MKTLLDRMAEIFDWIIIDSPPALPVHDASMLADQCDGVLFVVQGGEHGFGDCPAGGRGIPGQEFAGSGAQPRRFSRHLQQLLLLRRRCGRNCGKEVISRVPGITRTPHWRLHCFYGNFDRSRIVLRLAALQ